MRRRCRFGAGLLLLILPGPTLPTAAANDEARVLLLELWQESPLDLLEADIPEIAMLPGLDHDLAEAVAGLRAAQGLRALEDLLRIPGLGPAELDALRPYVRLGAAAPAAGVDLDFVAQRRERDPPRWRQVTRAVTGPLTLEHVALGADGSRRRAAGRVQVRERWCVQAGDLVLRGPADLFQTGLPRSRLAPASEPRSPALRARTDSGTEAGWTGVAIQRSGVGLLYAGRGPSQGLAFALALEQQGERGRWGLAARHGEGPPAVGGFLLGEAGRSAGWVSLAAEPDARSGALAARVSGQHWRLGLDAAAADGALSRGTDGVSGHRLDRSQRVLQVHGRLRGSGWSAAVVGRELRRGWTSAATGTLDLELVWRPRQPHGPDLLEFELRAAPERRITVLARFRPAGAELRVRFSRQTDGEEGAEIIGAELRRATRATTLLVAAAAVEGHGSRVWMLRRPGTGIYPVWLGPQDLMLALGCERSGPRLQLGAWAWVRGGGAQPPESGFGMACRIRAGALVRRLQD